MSERIKLEDDIMEGLKNTERDVLYLFDIKNLTVIKTTKDLVECVTQKGEMIIIENMLKDLLEMMEDFALDQDTEEIQEHLLQTLKNRDRTAAVRNFNRALLDYPRSKKSWSKLEESFLRERAKEFLDDFSRKITPK